MMPANEVGTDPLQGYFNTTSVDDLTYVIPPLKSQDGRAWGGFANVDTGRKSWRTFRDKREAVWPPFIEAALFEALEKYRPGSSGGARLLRRFPKRNRFISDYILKMTGKTRTSKQVGSRLQQLRDTCSEKRILTLLSRREFSPDLESKAERSSSSRGVLIPSVPSTPTITPPHTNNIIPTSKSPTTQHVCPPQRYVTIELYPSDPPPPPQTQMRAPALRLKIPEYLGANAPSSASSASPTSASTSSSMSSCLSSLASPSTYSPSTYSPISPSSSPSPFSHPCLPTSTQGSHPHHRLRIAAPTPLSAHIPSVTFTSAVPLDAAEHYSLFCVFLGDTHVQSEVTSLIPALPTDQHARGGPYAYTAQLIPGYWARLCQEGGLARCTVVQDIVRMPHATPGRTDEHAAAQNAVVLSIVYRFECTPGLVQQPAADSDPVFLPQHQHAGAAFAAGGPALPPDFPDVPVHARVPIHPAAWTEDSSADMQGGAWYRPPAHPQRRLQPEAPEAARGWFDSRSERWGVLDSLDVCNAHTYTYTYDVAPPWISCEHDANERAWGNDRVWR